MLCSTFSAEEWQKFPFHFNKIMQRVTKYVQIEEVLW